MASARHVFGTSAAPLVRAGGANVWWPDVQLVQSRSIDNAVLPYIRELLDDCGPVLVSPLDQATHGVVGSRLCGS